MTITEAPSPPTRDTIELVINNRMYACHHTKVVIDAKIRVVSCRDCGAQIDPFDAILTIANDSDRYSQGLDWKKRANAKLDAEHEQLKKLVSRMKSELKKLGIPYYLAHTLDTEKLADVAGIPSDIIERGRKLDDAYPTRKPKPKLRSISGEKKP